MNSITIWIMIIFFGTYAIYQAYLFYIKNNNMSAISVIFWWISVITTALLLNCIL